MRTLVPVAHPTAEPELFFEGGKNVRTTWPAPLFLSDEEYGHALEAFPRACADIVAVDIGARGFYLAKRRHPSAQGVWWFGGGQRMGETPREAAVRSLKRETGVVLKPEEFQFLAINLMFFKFRNPTPQERGEHDIGFTYAFVPTQEELETIKKSLDKEE